MVCGVLLLGSCTGLFQRQLPDVPARYATTVAGDELKVGFAERDITPAVGGYLAGFDIARRSDGIGSPLKVRAMVLEAGGRRFAIVGLDNLGLIRADADWIKSLLPGFAGGDVFLCASHTHAAPDLIGLWGWYLLQSGRDRDYLALVGKATADAVAEAGRRLCLARLVRAESRVPGKGCFKNPNRAGVFDRRLVAIQARSVADDQPLGALLHMACHPEVLPRRNKLVSSDFVGGLCDAWRDQGLGQAVFVNGALGSMVSPDWQPRTQAGAEQMGRELQRLMQESLSSADPVAVDAIEVRRSDVYLPLTTAGFRLGRLTGVVPRDVYDGHVRTTVGWLRIGDVRIVAVPGEIEPALAERIRGRLGMPDLIFFGLCDDELGYLMRLRDARDDLFAYERSVSICLAAGVGIAAATRANALR